MSNLTARATVVRIVLLEDATAAGLQTKINDFLAGVGTPPLTNVSSTNILMIDTMIGPSTYLATIAYSE